MNPRPGRDAPLGVFDSGLGGLTVVRVRKLAQAALLVETRVFEVGPDQKVVVLGRNQRAPLWARSMNCHDVSELRAPVALDRSSGGLMKNFRSL